MDAVEVALRRTDSRAVPVFYFGFYGQVALQLGDLEKAERIISDNLALLREAQSTHYEMESLCVLAMIRDAQGQREQAQELFKQAIQTFEQLDSRLDLGKALFYRGQAQIEWGQEQSGRESVERALKIFKTCKANYWVSKAREITA